MTWLWWAVWFPLAIGSFGLIEGYALRHPDRQWTLSECSSVGYSFTFSGISASKEKTKMLALLSNWKTTLAGAGVILAALADVATSASHGTVTPNLQTDLTAILVGLGLVAAKDSTSK